MKEEKWTPPSNASVTEQSWTPPSDAISVDEKKNSTPTSQSGSQDLSAPVRQDGVPSSENTEPIDLPTSYQSDRSNYKDLVSGGRYKLLRGGKPIIGTWDAEKQQFIKEPLLDYSVKPKQQGIIESVLPYPLNIPKPESEENVLGRVATDVDNIQKEAADKFVAAQYLSSFQPIQQLQTLEEAYKNNPTKQLRQSIDTLKSRKLSDTDFEGVRFEGDKNVYQGILPAPRVGEQLVPFEGELPKLPKTDMTVGEAYNELQDNKSYIEQAVNEVQGFNSFVNRELVKKLPEDKQQYLSSLSDTPLYQEELIKSLEQSNQSDNVVIAYLKGVEHSLNGIYQAGSTIGLDENQVYEKMLTEYNKEKLFGYKPQTFGAEIANSLGSLTPDVAAGAINPALFIASFGSRMPEEQLKNYYFDKIDKGEKPDFNEAWKYATTSTALQGALLFGAGAVGGAGKQIIGETFGKRAGEILTETAKRAGKDAVAFGAGGTYLQNKINKAYEVTENSDYLKSMIDMGVIGAALGLVHLSPQALKSKISEKTKNEVTDMAAFMPSNYVNKLLKDGIDTGRITDSDANAIQERMTLVRRIAAELPKNLSLDEINELVPLYQTKDALLVKQKDASPTIKDVLKGQIADLDQKILVKAGIPLSAEENAERASLIKKEATREGDIDKLRLKHLNARHEAIQKSKEQAKANEIAEEAGFDHAKHLLNAVKKEGLGEFETVQEVPKTVLGKLKEKKAEYQAGDVVELDPTITEEITSPKTETNLEASEGVSGSALKDVEKQNALQRIKNNIRSAVSAGINKIGKAVNLGFIESHDAAEKMSIEEQHKVTQKVADKARQELGDIATFIDKLREKGKTPQEITDFLLKNMDVGGEKSAISANTWLHILDFINDHPDEKATDVLNPDTELAPTQYTEEAGVSGSALKDVPTSLRGVKYSDIVVGDKHLEDILDENKLSDAEKNQVREIFSRGVDYFKFDKEGEQKFQEKFSNPEDITDVADIMTGVSAAQQSAFDFHNTKNYDNVKDAVNYIASNPNDYSPKVVKAVKEIKEKLDNPSSSMSRLYAIDVMKELGIKAPAQYTEAETGVAETKPVEQVEEVVELKVDRLISESKEFEKNHSEAISKYGSPKNEAEEKQASKDINDIRQKRRERDRGLFKDNKPDDKSDEVHDAILEDGEGMPKGYSATVIDSYYETILKQNHTISEVTTPNGGKYYLDVNTYESRKIGETYGDRESSEQVTEIAPKEEAKDYQVTTEPTKMLDGEDGVRVTITKPNGEKVELGEMYVEDVEKEVSKKIKGFELQKSKPTKLEEVVEEKPKQDLVGKEVQFKHAGSERKGIVNSIDEQGNLKVKSKDGTNYTVKPNEFMLIESVNQAKKSFADNLKKIDALIKQPEKDLPPPPKENAFVPKDVITLPFKALGFGDRLGGVISNKIQNGIANSFRRGMDNSNKYVSRASSEVQGLFKQLALSESDIEARRKALGQINVAPLKAVKFYQSGVNIVGKTPESLQNVHMVLDPEVYSKRGITPKIESDLSTSEKQLYDMLRSTNDMIHDWHFLNGRISQETYDKNKGTYAPRFYDNIEFEGLPNDLKSTFEDYAKQQNFSYVQERQNFEDVMNENVVSEDPVYGTSMRLAQMLRNQAIMEYAADLNTRIPTYVEGDKIPNSYIKLEGGGKFGNINTYGKLTNKYVPRDIAEDFKGATFLNYYMDGVYKLASRYDRNAIRQVLKKTKTLYNPITQLGNIGSNYVFAMMNGIDPLTYQARKFEAVNIVKDKSDLYVKLVEEGVLGTDIVTKDLKEEAKGVSKKGGLLSRIDDSISDFYGSRDDIAKVAAYLAHTKDYGRSEKEALKRVSEGFQNYNNVGRFYDFGSKLPVVGNPFIKFKGDLLRIMKNNFSNRPLTNIAFLAGLNTIATAFSQWSNEDEDLKEARERRSFIPKVPLPEKVGGDIPLVWQTPIGEINAARYFSPFNIYDMGDKSSTVEEVTQFLPVPLKRYEGASMPLPNISDPFLGVYAQLALDEDFRGKPILDPEANKWREGNATTEEKLQNAITFIARQQIPFFANANDIINAYSGEKDYYGRNKDLKQALLSNIVKIEQKGRPEVIEDLEKEIEYRLKKMDKLNGDINASKKLAEKNISKIRERKLDEYREQTLIKNEYERSQNKIAEILDEQAEIKRQLIEPEELIQKIGGKKKEETGKLEKMPKAEKMPKMEKIK